MIVEPKVAVENGTEQFYMVREWHDAASDVYITTSWHERSDILARPKTMASDLSGLTARPLCRNQEWSDNRQVSRQVIADVHEVREMATYSCVSSAYCC